MAIIDIIWQRISQFLASETRPGGGHTSKRWTFHQIAPITENTNFFNFLPSNDVQIWPHGGQKSRKSVIWGKINFLGDWGHIYSTLEGKKSKNSLFYRHNWMKNSTFWGPPPFLPIVSNFRSNCISNSQVFQGLKKYIHFIEGQKNRKSSLYYRFNLRGNSTFWMIGVKLTHYIRGQVSSVPLPSFGNWSLPPSILSLESYKLSVKSRQ